MSSRLTRTLLALVACALPLAGCTGEGSPDLPYGGTNTVVGRMHVDDVWVDGPRGIDAGANAPLHLVLTNDSRTPDALVEVSTPIARSVQLREAGRPVTRIVVPAGAQKDFEWRSAGVLEDLRHHVAASQWFPMTLRFAHAGTITVHVSAGPFGDGAPSSLPVPTAGGHHDGH